jgi:uncharacterized membrane protein YcaP (DUF421 family)
MSFWAQVNELLGLDRQAQDLRFNQIALRAFFMFFAVLTMLRVSDKRFLAQRNALDTLLGFLLASMLARAINGSERFFETIGGGFVVVFLHRILARAAARSHRFGRWLKGEPEVLVERGEMNRAAMARHNISEHDLGEDLRLRTGSDDVGQVERAQLERNGEISVKNK